MPTHDEVERFWRDWARLTAHQQEQFITAVDKLVHDLKAGQGFRPGLRVKLVQGHEGEGIWEMTWAPNGRATFHYGAERSPGDPHVIWRRIGGHDIFSLP
jgi:hypothetical protein